MLEKTSKALAIWNHWKTGAVLIVVTAAVATWLILRPQLPGIAVAVLALSAAIMSLRTDTNLRERAGWCIVLGLLLIAETIAIHKDRAESDKAAANKQIELNTQFQGIASQIRQDIAGNQSHYVSTLRQVNGVLQTTQGVGKLAKRNLEELSGADSYPCIVPDAMVMSLSSVPFSIWNRGKNMLTGVEVSLLNMQEYQEARRHGDLKSIVIGTLPSEWPKSIPAISPKIDFGDVGKYRAEIWTQNGVYDEMINFRKSRNPKLSAPWAYQYWLSKQVVSEGPTKEYPYLHKGDRMSVVMRGCDQPKWSDGSKEDQ
jgi:hypothetical protein